MALIVRLVRNRYYPLRIGEVLNTKYQILGKLGFGLGSTVWLANDLFEHRTVALKIFTSDRQNREEINIYNNMRSIKSKHPGRRHIRDALDAFTLQGSKGERHCLVHEPMCENISASNILLKIEDVFIIDTFIKTEKKKFNLRPEKNFDLPKGIGEAVLSDFGSAVFGDVPHDEDVKPDVYRSPEVCLKMSWIYSIDIWNLGTLLRKHIFHGRGPKEDRYMTRAHIAEMVALMGPPPLELLKCRKRSSEFFNKDGHCCSGIDLPKATSLEESEGNLEGVDRESFLSFIRKMLQWEPRRPQTAKKLLQDPWLNGTSEKKPTSPIEHTHSTALESNVIVSLMPWHDWKFKIRDMRPALNENVISC
ncbi:kinase-like protein [Corynespora cassiicola Philippines]|uniref:non-specific serine/threonine protein kinase n=1 Tax=Corynespora cassiicola Philippines TaxID=1448308 RepID=A0A2T2N8Z5_CORCC|nr:kinase-like protein [Corynespora cassiicola Philippines]